jgi:hypothetical protein
VRVKKFVGGKECIMCLKKFVAGEDYIVCVRRSL